jgi:hypothetical protein
MATNTDEDNGNKLTVSEPIVVTVVGKGPEVGESGTIASTPEGQANLVTRVITPAKALAIRFLHRFVDTIVGAEALQNIDSLTGWQAIPHSSYKVILAFAAVTAIWGLLRDCGTVLTRLEGKFPLSTGNV